MWWFINSSSFDRKGMKGNDDEKRKAKIVAGGDQSRFLEVGGAEAEAEAADVSEDTAQKVAMFCVSSVGCELLSEP